MILAKVTFSGSGRCSRRHLKGLVETYLPRLLHQGQIGSEYFVASSGRAVHAFVQLVALDAYAPRFHSEYGRETLTALTHALGQPPKWVILDDDTRKRTGSWRRTPFLYLFTHAFDDGPVFYRGDNGTAVPAYYLPVSYRDRESAFFWQDNYRHHDHVWLGCGALELPAYRELVEPASELSQHGRDLCKRVEESTGIPTYYFLMWYWGRRAGETQRKCPGCGRTWRTKHAAEKGGDFWKFAFQCAQCRLVSHFADSCDDQRRAVIGEFKAARRKTSG